jgi:hypothetical protein
MFDELPFQFTEVVFLLVEKPVNEGLGEFQIGVINKKTGNED